MEYQSYTVAGSVLVSFEQKIYAESPQQAEQALLHYLNSNTSFASMENTFAEETARQIKIEEITLDT